MASRADSGHRNELRRDQRRHRRRPRCSQQHRLQPGRAPSKVGGSRAGSRRSRPRRSHPPRAEREPRDGKSEAVRNRRDRGHEPARAGGGAQRRGDRRQGAGLCDREAVRRGTSPGRARPEPSSFELKASLPPTLSACFRGPHRAGLGGFAGRLPDRRPNPR